MVQAQSNLVQFQEEEWHQKWFYPSKNAISKASFKIQTIFLTKIDLSNIKAKQDKLKQQLDCKRDKIKQLKADFDKEACTTENSKSQVCQTIQLYLSDRMATKAEQQASHFRLLWRRTGISYTPKCQLVELHDVPKLQQTQGFVNGQRSCRAKSPS